jgi:L-ascorbate metabolism protein UlaG (beta-lactamase superfamily)
MGALHICRADTVQAVHLSLIRNATLVIRAAGLRLLVDPQLDPAGARPAVPNTPNPRPNPLVELPEPPEALVARLDAVLVTHLHQDHFDDTARRLLARELPLLCQPEDSERLRGDGFTDVRAVQDELTLGDLRIVRTGGCHGTGTVGAAMAPVSGFVLSAPGEPSVYIAGDTILCDHVRDTIATHDPDVVVVNASAARFLDSEPIVMDADDVVELAALTPARIVAVHLDAIAHATETRADLRERLHGEGLIDRVAVPEDGSEVPL